MRQLLILIGLLASPAVLTADTVFTVNQADWQAAVGAHDNFVFTSANTGLADELAAAPGNNAQIGPSLTFQQSNTGLGYAFQIQTLEAGAGFTWHDTEGDSDFNDALSIGDINNFDDDDFRIDFTDGLVTAFGFDLRDNDSSAGESFSVFSSSGLLGTFNTIPAATGSSFVGVWTNDGFISHVIFDEDSGGDDIAIRSISVSTNAIPEPGSLGLLGIAIFGFSCRRKRVA